jgi:hypothetical protein
LFFSPDQILRNQCTLYTNGTDMSQLISHLNVNVYYLQKAYPWQATGRVGQLITAYFQALAGWNLGRLADCVLQHDADAALPRVVFCNAVWTRASLVAPSANADAPTAPAAAAAAAPAAVVYDDTRHIGDHQWSIIKHGNDSFQLISGYMPVVGQLGHCLGTWQNQPIRRGGGNGRAGGNSSANAEPSSHSREHSTSGRRYASRQGFSRAEMRSFLDGLSCYGSTQRFSAAAHQQLFGAYLREWDGQDILPTLAFRELGDSSVEGNGDRFVAAGVEKDIEQENAKYAAAASASACEPGQ